MNVERMQLKGQLAEAKSKFRNLDTEASGLIVLIRSYLNPYDEIENLQIEKATVSVNRLDIVIKEIKELQAKIKLLEAEFD